MVLSCLSFPFPTHHPYPYLSNVSHFAFSLISPLPSPTHGLPLRSQFRTLFLLCPSGSFFPNPSPLPIFAILPIPSLNFFGPFSDCCPSFGFPPGLIFLHPPVASHHQSLALLFPLLSSRLLSKAYSSPCPWV